MDVAIAVLAGELLAVLSGGVEVPPVHDHLRSERAHRGELDRVGVLGDTDARGDAEQPRGEGDRLPVIARRRSDQPAPALLLAELRHEVDAAADLERSHRLVVLVLHPDLGANQLSRPAYG